MRALLTYIFLAFSILPLFGQYGSTDVVAGVANTRSGVIVPDYTLDAAIPDNAVFQYDPGTGAVTVYSTGRQELATVTLKNGGTGSVFPLTLRDKDGKLVQVDTEKNPDGSVKVGADGKPVLAATTVTPIPDDAFNPNAITGDATVTFERGSGEYALDNWPAAYKAIALLADNYRILAGDYRVPWKFLPTGGRDVVTAVLNLGKGSKISPDSIVFSTPQGFKLASKQLPGNRYELTVAAGQARDVQEVYALYPVQGSSSRFQTLGKLEAVTYDTQAQKLVLVPVNGAGVDKDAVERYLDEVYHPVGVDWSVEEAANFTYADTTAFFAKGSGLLSAYTPAMRRLNDAYRQERGFAPGTAYLFVMDDSGRGRDRDAAGFMPRGKQAGYIFKGSLGGYDIAQVIAHELGHGRWRLRHTFDKAYGGVLAQESTDNLMDYKAGNNSLAKWQWDEIVSPAWFTNPFEGDGEGEITLSPGEYLGFSPQGDVIKGRPADYGGVFYTEGSYFVTHFKIKDKTLYSWDSSQKCYLNPKGDRFKDFATEPVTGKVAVWNPNYKNDCFAVYKWVEVKGYTKAVDFAAIQDKVQTDDGTGWTPDIKEDASEACKAEAEKVKGGIKPNCTELPANQDTLTLNWLKEKNFQGMDAECLAGVSTPKRKELIAEIASKQAITGSDETLLQKLTVSTPGVQAEEIYRSIRDGGLIGSVLEKTQLAAHNDILAQLILWQRKWENSHTPRKTIVFSESSMWPGALKGVDAAPEENGVKLQSGWISEMGWDVEERFSFTDNVWIYFHDAAGSYKAHQAYHLTALEAYSIFSKQARKETIQTARLMADVALMAVAVGEISACYDAYKASKGVYGLYLLIKSGTDASVGLADIVIQNALAEQWSKTPEGLARLDRWNKICTLYAAGSLSASAIDLAVKKFGKTVTEGNFDEVCSQLEGAKQDLSHIIYPSTKINGIPVVRILTGNNGKIAIIGRKMPYVEDVANNLSKLGKEVEIFDTKTAFAGKGYNNFKQIDDEWKYINVSSM